jgi:hypothetical protein
MVLNVVLTTTVIMGSLILSTATILSKEQNYDRCMTRSLYDVPSTTKIIALPMTYQRNMAVLGYSTFTNSPQQFA